jgi:hypothetical protein
MLPVTYPQSHNYQQDDFHKIVARTLSQGSTPMSMDFHPLQQTLLLGKFLLYYCFFIIKVWVSPCSAISVCCIYPWLAAVGTNVGDIGLWDVGTKDRLVVRNFKVWDLSKCIMILQVCLLHYVFQALVIFY